MRGGEGEGRRAEGKCVLIAWSVPRLGLECFSIVRIVVCCQTRDILLLELPSSIIQQTVSAVSSSPSRARFRSQQESKKIN